MIDVKDALGGTMTQEIDRTWDVSEEVKKRWEEFRQKMKDESYFMIAGKKGEVAT